VKWTSTEKQISRQNEKIELAFSKQFFIALAK